MCCLQVLHLNKVNIEQDWNYSYGRIDPWDIKRAGSIFREVLLLDHLTELKINEVDFEDNLLLPGKETDWSKLRYPFLTTSQQFTTRDTMGAKVFHKYGS